MALPNHQITRHPRIAVCAALLLHLAAAGADLPAPAFDFLRAGEVRPEGWLKEQMLADLRDGLAGHYDEICANVDQQVFVAKNRAPEVMVPNEGRPEKSWWAGEHEGYWKDGVIRLAFLTGDQPFMDRARHWVEAIVAAQGADGYIGIYDETTRFPLTKDSDGELWSQSRIFQAMLAYHEFTGDRKVLNAVEKAVNLTLAKYPDTYFCRPGKITDGGVSHGLGLGDTLEQLYRLTGNPVYGNGVVRLYEDYCRGFPEDDTTPAKLLDPNEPWRMHAPHIMEGIAVPQIVARLTGEERYRQAARNILPKLARHTTPGGGLVGDENVRRRPGTGETYTEYCSFTEGAVGLNRFLAYSGDLQAGDRVEHVALNAAQGARTHTVNRAVAYLSRDNQRTTDQQPSIKGKINFSASHAAAACCTLNSTRLLPYYVEGMWFRPAGPPALVANLYGPCRVATRIAGVPVAITEETAYPFEDRIVFRLAPDRPVEFTLVFRIPPSARDVEAEAGPGARITRLPGRLEIHRLWQTGDSVTLHFDFAVQRRESNDGQFYYQRGPLVFALKFPEKMTETKRFSLNGKDSGFGEYLTVPLDDTGWDYQVDPAAAFSLETLAAGDLRHPWAHPPVALRGQMRTSEGRPVAVQLVPEGSTILRRVTFPAATP